MKLKSILLTAVTTLSLATATMAQVPNYVPTNGLVGWWPFNGNANDESGNGNNGTVNGASLTKDRNGILNKAYSLDGLNDIITINNSKNFNFTSGQAISFWVKVNSFPPSSESIIFSQQLSSSTSAVGYNISVSASGHLNYRYGNGSLASFGGVLFNNININQWLHVVCQYQNGIGTVFINSQIINTYQANAQVGLPGVSLVIGDDTWGAGSGAKNYAGVIDDISIFNRSLTQQEVNILNNGCQPSITSQPNNLNNDYPQLYQ